jgi:hypothetical protein
MRRLAFTIFFTFLAGSLTITAAQGSSAALSLNKPRSIKGAGLSVTFLQLVEDSRCPADVNCIWAGNARIKLRIAKPGQRSQIIELDSNGPAASAKAFGHEIRLARLTPERRTGREIRMKDLKALIEIERLSGS